MGLMVVNEVGAAQETLEANLHKVARETWRGEGRGGGERKRQYLQTTHTILAPSSRSRHT